MDTYGGYDGGTSNGGIKVMALRDYLNSNETNDYMTIRFTVMVLKRILKEWGALGNLTKEEITNIKYAVTYTTKFFNLIQARLNPKENDKFNKRLAKFEFKLVDDYQFKKIFRDTQNAMVNAVMPREDFNNFCEEIMDVRCKDCNKDWSTCKLHDVFENNFAVEPTGYELPNCRFAFSSAVKFKKAEGAK